ncbi:MAG: A/G-specific adenine glycosylase [Myxococcales bacterium]|nr:A/G-specific adenine glycosylase [Myxococcales bacterium]
MKTQAIRLDTYYRKHARDLPWRHTTDPYRIWVSEIMLQQTRVEAVRERYVQFLERFPHVYALAAANLDEVRAEWSGLGYYRRARYLWEGARYIVEQHGGVFPDNSTALQAVPGIGEYTSCAVAAIAFGEPVAAIDGNVLRVGSRVLGIDAPKNSAALRKPVKAWADAIVENGEPSILVQALMEIGATVCTPRSVACAKCPFGEDCIAKSTLPDPTVLPTTTPKAPRSQWKGVLFAALTPDEALFLQRRPEKGLLAGLWFLPGLVGEQADLMGRLDDPASLLHSILPGATIVDAPPAVGTWQFSHIDLNATIYRAQLPTGFNGAAGRVNPPPDWAKEALPSVTRHLLSVADVHIGSGPTGKTSPP